MKFTSFVVAFGLVSSIVASPVALEKKQSSAPAAISSIVTTLTQSVNTNLVTINNLVRDVDDNLDASAAVSAAVRANLQAIQKAFQTATNSLTAVTVGTVGGVAGIVQQFGADQVTQLTADIQKIRDLLAGISVTAELVADNLAPAVLTAVNAELLAVQGAIKPFVDPLNALAAEVANANATAVIRVLGLRVALTGLGSILTGLINRLLGL